MLNGDANNEESDVSDNENDEAPEEEDEGEEDNESFRLNISDDEIESDDVDKEEEVNDVEDFRMEINEIGELTSADKDVGETIERLNNGDDGSNAENLVEDLQDDDEEVSTVSDISYYTCIIVRISLVIYRYFFKKINVSIC